MNQTLDVIMKRRSTRAYSHSPITDDEKDTILEATLRAPTAGNMMLYSIVEVDSQNLKNTLAETCDHQSFIAKAPWVLLYLADFQRQYDYFDYCEVSRLCQERGIPYRMPETADLMLACCDALIAAQTTVLAAESLGIGSCYIGDIMENYEVHRDLLHLPRYVFPIALLCLGRPVRELSDKGRSSRFDREFIVYKDSYTRLSGGDFKRMYGPLETPADAPRQYYQGADNIGQAMYLRKTSSDFSLEMVRSVKVMLDNWK
ncbi:MAG: nitroreductase family protein [Anaerolineaceae bacterium]|nr:nitroreductase family protein [Anaerolineaceae bacterium]MBN2676952.1 nitroreductase family protein [Anaerolineaceae bacterium]